MTSWTDERIELLRQLWNDGHSGSEVAERLGGISRNAVMGKISRLGLMGRSGSTKAKHRARTHPKKAQATPTPPKPEPTEKAAKPAKRWANERTFVLRNLPRAERLEEAREVAAAYVPHQDPVDGGVPYGEREHVACGFERGEHIKLHEAAKTSRCVAAPAIDPELLIREGTLPRA